MDRMVESLVGSSIVVSSDFLLKVSKCYFPLWRHIREERTSPAVLFKEFATPALFNLIFQAWIIGLSVRIVPIFIKRGQVVAIRNRPIICRIASLNCEDRNHDFP